MTFFTLNLDAFTLNFCLCLRYQSLKNRLRYAMGATSSERERQLLRNGSRIHRRPYLYIALLPVLTMALCPAFVCTCWTHHIITLYTPFRAVYAPMYTRYACIYIIYTPNAPLNTLYTP